MLDETESDACSTDQLHRAYDAKNLQETAQVCDDRAAEYEQHMRYVDSSKSCNSAPLEDELIAQVFASKVL